MTIIYRVQTSTPPVPKNPKPKHIKRDSDIAVVECMPNMLKALGCIPMKTHTHTGTCTHTHVKNQATKMHTKGIQIFTISQQ